MKPILVTAAAFAAGALLCLALARLAVPSVAPTPPSPGLSGQGPARRDSSPDVAPVPAPGAGKRRLGTPGPARPEVPDLPPSGSATLRDLFGWEEEVYLGNSVSGFVPNRDGPFPYERRGGTTTVTFPSGWRVSVNDATGTILVPPGLPGISDESLADLTWRAFVADDGLERWRDACRLVNGDGDPSGGLLDVRLDEIRRVGDKAVVAWRHVDAPSPDDGGFIRSVYWVDVRTRKIVHEGVEVNEP